MSAPTIRSNRSPNRSVCQFSRRVRTAGPTGVGRSNGRLFSRAKSRAGGSRSANRTRAPKAAATVPDRPMPQPRARTEGGGEEGGGGREGGGESRDRGLHSPPPTPPPPPPPP